MKTRKAFTLIEIIVSIAVFGLVMAVIGSVFYKVYQDWQRQRDYLHCIENIRWAMEFMTTEIRLSSKSSIGSTEIPGLGYACGHYKRLDFEINPSADGKNPFIDIEYRKKASDMSEALTPDTLIRRAKDHAGGGGGAWSNQVLSTYIVDNPTDPNHFPPGCPYKFFEISSGLVTMMYTVRPRPGDPEGPGNKNYTITMQVRPRNP